MNWVWLFLIDPDVVAVSLATTLAVYLADEIDGDQLSPNDFFYLKNSLWKSKYSPRVEEVITMVRRPEWETLTSLGNNICLFNQEKYESKRNSMNRLLQLTRFFSIEEIDKNRAAKNHAGRFLREPNIWLFSQRKDTAQKGVLHWIVRNFQGDLYEKQQYSGIKKKVQGFQPIIPPSFVGQSYCHVTSGTVDKLSHTTFHPKVFIAH